MNEGTSVCVCVAEDAHCMKISVALKVGRSQFGGLNRDQVERKKNSQM